MSKEIVTFLFVKGNRNRLRFKRINKYFIEMTGYEPGSLNVGTLNGKAQIEALPIEEGPYLYRGLNMQIVGFEGTLAHFHIADNKVELSLRQ